MSLPYSSLGNFTGSIVSGSYLSAADTNLFVQPQLSDIWFGFSPNDVVEFSLFDITSENNLISWSLEETEKHFKDVSLTILDSKESVQQIQYKELINEFILYKNNAILVNPVHHLQSLNTAEGSYKVSYVFNRLMAGSPSQPLSIQEISPSRKEIKLLPTKEITAQYTAFCLKKFPISDVAPVLLSSTKQCPYDQIYQRIKNQYTDSINFLKTIFFLPDDGSVLIFLKNLYEDFIKFTLLSEDQIDQGFEPTRILRIQGIRTYYSNFLLSNFNSVSDFTGVENKFKDFVNLRLDQAFNPFKDQTVQQFADARKFVYDFFVIHFYENVTKPLEEAYRVKYNSFFKNVLNFGNNKYFPILNNGFLDERSGDQNVPLTLVVKLSAELPPDISEKTTCWVSNFSMVPFVATVILRNPVKFSTITISAPNFNVNVRDVNIQNSNKQFSLEDLELDQQIKTDVSVNKKSVNLNFDYTSFSSFVVFSSAADRLNIFKNKSKQYFSLSGSIVNLDIAYLNSLSSSVVYPHYTVERNDLIDQVNTLVDSFDGYESYLFKSNKYFYDASSGSFISSSYIETKDDEAELYDRNNRDSLVNNTPDYLKLDPQNDEYFTFLSMIGHHFDNIYTYITSLPIERQPKNEVSSSQSTNTLRELLTSFGWNVDDLIENLDIDQVYLNSLNSTTYNSISAEERLRTIWNRILITLPGLYKNKGTEECVRFLLASYGLPSSFINIREYGGIDFSENFKQSYTLDEKVYMLKFSGNNDHIEGPFPDNIDTVEFKFSVEDPQDYTEQKFNPLFTKYPYSYNTFPSHSFALGFKKVAGQYSGQVIFEMGSGSSGATITSSVLPIFNGDVFSVMLRRNNPIARFEDSVDKDAVPLKYELYVQRNDGGRRIFYSTSSKVLEVADNRVFSNPGKFKLGNGYFLTDNKFDGTLDKLALWDAPITDLDFESHVNDLNSYSYSGSNAYKHLWLRLGWEFPESLYFNISGSSSVWVDNRSPYYALPNYHSSQSLSSSFVPSLYSASLEIIQDLWRPHLPSGSIDITAYNFPRLIHPNWTSSFDSTVCSIISSSAFPFSFRQLNYQNGLDTSKFGPNKFKNEKIRQLDYTIEARLDPADKSTNPTNFLISPDSNILGLFIDPQDATNKDMVRYVGPQGIMELIGDPEDVFKGKYPNLVNKDFEYHAAGNKRILFTELMTVYKFYFDKSVFSAIKNVMPARATVISGIIVEPTILERPKYENKPLTSSIARTLTLTGNISSNKSPFRLSMSLDWANFNTNFSGSSQTLIDSLPHSYQQNIDLRYINNDTRDYPTNFNGNYVPNSLDNIQFSMYPDFENCNHAEITSSNVIFGSISRRKNEDPPQVNQTFYMLKVWETYKVFRKSGPYTHSVTPIENTQSSQSIFLYKYVVVDQPFMNNLIYMKTNDVDGINDPSHIYFGAQYTHSINTFKGTPDQIVNNIIAININPIDPSSFDLQLQPYNSYFEIVRGYPRNHYLHKAQQFSNNRFATAPSSFGTSSVFTKGQQTISTTISETGIDDGSPPVQKFNVNNVKVINSDNVVKNKSKVSDSGLF